MRAAVLTDYKHDLSLVDLPVPDPRPGEVLLRVAGCGLCHSDLHLRDGEIPMLPEFPWVLGHEVSGRVAALGAGVTGLDPGEPVLVHGGWGCGRCEVCLGGTEQLCTTTGWVGIGRPGGFAEYLCVPAARHLVPLGDLDPTLSAPLADAALTPYHAIRLTGDRLRPGTTAVVIGVGGLGQYAVQMLRDLTGARVVAVDTDADKRSRALELGATLALHPSEVGESLLASSAAVLDVVGSEESLALGLSMLARQGLLVIVGLGGGALPVSFLGMAAEASVTTSYWGTRNDLAEVVALAQAGRIEGKVHEVDLAGLNGALSDLRAGHVDGRVVLVP